MWLEAIEIGLVLADFAYHRWKDDDSSAPKPTPLTLPRATEGSPVPLIYGTTRCQSPIAIWAGNSTAPGQPYKNSATDPDSTESVNHYFVDISFLLGISFYGDTNRTKLLNAWAGDTKMEASVNASLGTTQGFRFGPGGADYNDASIQISGVFFQGSRFQYLGGGGATWNDNPGTTVWADGVNYGFVVSSPSAMVHGGVPATAIPAHRNQVILFGHFALGQSATIPGFSFEVAALSTGSASHFGRSLLDDADPMAVLLDIITSPWGKLGLTKDAVDLASFDAASLVLYNESHGYSRFLAEDMDARDVIQEILKQVDGVMYVEPTTRKITTKLIRFDYDPNALDEINPDNASPAGSNWITIQGWAEVPNQVRIKFTDRGSNYTEGVAIGQESAGISVQGDATLLTGRLRSVDVNFPGCCTQQTANRIASRELTAQCRPSIRINVTTDRSFYGARIGSVYRFRWPPLGMNIVVRVAAVNWGQLHDGKITLSLMQDIFDTQVGAYNFFF